MRKAPLLCSSLSNLRPSLCTLEQVGKASSAMVCKDHVHVIIFLDASKKETHRDHRKSTGNKLGCWYALEIHYCATRTVDVSWKAETHPHHIA